MTTENSSLTFRVLGREPITGRIKNPEARLGDVAERLARRENIAGTFECLNREGQVLSPDCRLADLPTDEEITLAPELTPA
jgi:hypothetical protein